MDVRELTPDGFRAWDSFVEGCPAATFFHLAGWKTILERVFGHRTHYLYAERDGRIEGVLPLGHIKSRLFGNALISTPFCVYGGVAAQSSAAFAALDAAAIALAERLGVDYLEYRCLAEQHAHWPRKHLYVTFRKAIHADPDRNMKDIPRKQRAMVRKGIEYGLESEIDVGVDRLYDAYAHSVRTLGTPVFPKAYFQALRQTFGERCEVLTVTHEGRLVSSVMSFYFRDEVLPYYAGGLPRARELKGNDFMYWELMRRSCQRGVRMFDYGRSKEGTGSWSFKKNWGFQPQPLPYEYHLVKAGRVPDVSPLNPKYRFFIAAWKRMPLSLTKLIGPRIVRNLG
jgi:FemAB-related protein (PEP-CTERM system-associated)